MSISKTYLACFQQTLVQIFKLKNNKFPEHLTWTMQNIQNYAMKKGVKRILTKIEKISWKT